MNIPMRFLFLFIVGLSFAVSPAASLAQNKSARPGETPQADANQPAWIVNCSGVAGDQLVCNLSQTQIAKQTGQRIISAQIFREKPDSSPVLRLSLPHGLLLPRGVDVWVDEGEKSNYPIQTADQNGSYSTVPVDIKLSDAMKRGTILNIGVTAVSGDTIILQLSLIGFTAGFSRV